MKYTVTAYYYATGEGVTISLLYAMATSPEDALERFTGVFGSYLALGAEVKEGYDFDCREAGILLSDSAKRILEDQCHNGFNAQIHFNYS